jgi:adenylate cyclase class 2
MESMEIELKAHARDRKAVLQKLNAFAVFDKSVSKDDRYFKLEKSGAPNGRITARIRQEKNADQNGRAFEEKIFLTYKKKEKRLASGGGALEVNQEYEAALDNAECLEALFADVGFVPYFTKHKDAVGFYADTPCGKAHLELCSVPPLGDFLEIEFVGDGEADESQIAAMRKELESLVVKCGLALDDIEEKYYSELLAEAGIIKF